jgi:type IV pilus assembly protein PilQ
MKKHKQTVLLYAVILFTILFGSLPVLFAANSAKNSAATMEISAEGGYLNDVSFQKMEGKARIILTLSKKTVFNIEESSNHTIVMKLDNTSVAKELRRPLGEGLLENVARVLPDQKSVGQRPWVYLAIELRTRIPYSIKWEKENLLIDFNITAIAKNHSQTLSKEEKPTQALLRKEETKESVMPQVKEEVKKEPEPKIISLDFQDADIKAVLRLLSEISGCSIVSGNDVKGNITVYMKRVPWNQALDTILDISGLAKKQTGDVITVMTFKKMREDEENRKKGEEERLKAEALLKETQQKELAAKGGLRQISIEAKIVEATDSFIRRLGIQWGAGVKGTWGKYDIGALIGTNPSYAAAKEAGYKTNYSTGDQTKYDVSPVLQLPAGIGLTNSANLAVNLPSVVASPSIGVIMGSAKSLLDAQLAALETSGGGEIISSPRVTTMDGVKAIIKQGEEVPIVTPGTANEPPTVTFKEALLRLEVTPKITAERKISMEITAANDAPNWDKSVQGNPPINKSEVQSTVVIGNAETIVIGGVIKTTNEKNIEGVPWLSKIPLLGWLFKTESITKTKRQLLVVVTPKIIEENAMPENVAQARGQ